MNRRINHHDTESELEAEIANNFKRQHPVNCQFTENLNLNQEAQTIVDQHNDLQDVGSINNLTEIENLQHKSYDELQNNRCFEIKKPENDNQFPSFSTWNVRKESVVSAPNSQDILNDVTVIVHRSASTQTDCQPNSFETFLPIYVSETRKGFEGLREIHQFLRKNDEGDDETSFDDVGEIFLS